MCLAPATALFGHDLLEAVGVLRMCRPCVALTKALLHVVLHCYET